MTNPEKPARLCRNMTDLRAEIDRLDRALVAQLAERQSYIERAAEIKTDRNRVHDQARIDDVVAKVLATARQAETEGAEKGQVSASRFMMQG